MKGGLFLVVCCMLLASCGGRTYTPQYKNYPEQEWAPKITLGLYAEAYALAMDSSSKDHNAYRFLWHVAHQDKTDDLFSKAPDVLQSALAGLERHRQIYGPSYDHLLKDLVAVRADVLRAQGQRDEAASIIRSFVAEQDVRVFLDHSYCSGAAVVSKAAYKLAMFDEAFKAALHSVLGVCGQHDQQYEATLAMMRQLNATETFDQLSARRARVRELAGLCQYDQSITHPLEAYYACWLKVFQDAGISDIAHYYQRQLTQAQESRIASEKAQEEMRRAAAERAQYQDEGPEEDYSGWGIAKNVMDALNESVQMAASPPSTPQQLLDRMNRMNEMYEGNDSGSRTTSASEEAGRSTVAEASGCPEDLAFVGNRLPRFAAAELSSLRQQIIVTSVRDTIQGAKSQGYTALAAIDAAQKQAIEHEQAARQGAACAADVDAWGTTDQQFLSRINNREYANVACDGIRGACLCSAIMNKMGALNARALAGAMRCHYGKGTW